jgi:nuclear GTP-binding protein
MYKGGKPVRDRNGKIVKAAEFQASQAGKARVQPDRRWFGNTRVIGQAELDRFREEMTKQVNDPYQVVLRQSKLPMSLLTTPSTVRLSRPAPLPPCRPRLIPPPAPLRVPRRRRRG